MKVRIITGLIGGIFIALVTYLGGALFDIVYYAIACIGVYEIARLLSNRNKFSYEVMINCVLAFVLYFIGYFIKLKSINLILFTYILFNLILYATNSKITLKRLLTALFAGIYVVLFIYHMILLNHSKNIYIWLVYIVSFGTDTFAYFTGVFWGKHKLCPHISPKKTIEGAIGGIVGCTIITLIFFHFLGINNFFSIIIFSIFASIFSILGDLLASAIKREFKVKDYGTLLPGHGGIMDRFDSLLFIAPVVYYFVTYLI